MVPKSNLGTIKVYPTCLTPTPPYPQIVLPSSKTIVITFQFIFSSFPFEKYK